MKTLIVYVSYHRMNTDRVDRAMAEATGATMVPVDEVVSEDLDAFELIGFGSGIYDGRHHGDLFALVGRMPAADRAVFVFSTSSGASPEHHRALKDALEAKWRRIAGEFLCRGEYRLLRVIAASRSHPDEKDPTDARTFASRLVAA